MADSKASGKGETWRAGRVNARWAHRGVNARSPEVTRPRLLSDGVAECIQPLLLVRLNGHDRDAELPAQTSTSIWMPWAAATSIMFSATTTGTPSSSACVVR